MLCCCVAHKHNGSRDNYTQADTKLKSYTLPSRFPVHERPNLVLNAEEELGIAAGLQDRVVQVYGGIVFMDFGKEHMQAHGYGRCCSIWLEYMLPARSAGNILESPVDML